MRSILKGATDQSVVIRIVDSADGTPETGVTSGTGGLDLRYRREGAATVALTESDLSALTDAHSDGGLLHIIGGYYRVDIPDAAFATGVNGVLVAGTVTGMVVIGCYVHLVDYNPQDAVRLGLTALPNAAAEAAGGLYTRGTGAGQINQAANGMVDTNPVRLNNVSQSLLDLKDFADDGYDPSTNKVQGLVLADAVTVVNGLAANVITAASIAADAITDAKVASDVTIASVTGAVGSVTGAVGSVTAGVTLANDAITAAKFDESTAFPLKADDSGATQVARVGADSDTLETLSDQLDAKASQASVDDLPTNAELATSQAAADDATLAAISALNNLSAAQVNTEVDTALADYDGPTHAELVSEINAVQTDVAGVRNRLSTLVTKTATVQTDGGNSATQILTDLAETEVDHWRYALVKLTSGALSEQVRKCTGYDGAGTLTFTDGFSDIPADGVTLELIND